MMAILFYRLNTCQEIWIDFNRVLDSVKNQKAFHCR